MAAIELESQPRLERDASRVVAKRPCDRRRRRVGALDAQLRAGRTRQRVCDASDVVGRQAVSPRDALDHVSIDGVLSERPAVGKPPRSAEFRGVCSIRRNVVCRPAQQIASVAKAGVKPPDREVEIVRDGTLLPPAELGGASQPSADSPDGDVEGVGEIARADVVDLDAPADAVADHGLVATNLVRAGGSGHRANPAAVFPDGRRSVAEFAELADAELQRLSASGAMRGPDGTLVPVSQRRSWRMLTPVRSATSSWVRSVFLARSLDDVVEVHGWRIRLSLARAEDTSKKKFWLKRHGPSRQCASDLPKRQIQPR